MTYILSKHGGNLYLVMYSMLSRFMFLDVLPPPCLIVTFVTKIFYTFMNRFLVSLKTALYCSLIITLITRIFYTFMNRLLMGLKTAPCCSLIVTLITRIFHTFMDCFLMSLKIACISCLILAEFTWITNTFMCTAGVKIHAHPMFRFIWSI